MPFFGVFHFTPSRDGELVAQLRVVEMTDRPAPRVQRPGVQRRPATVDRRVHQVRDDDVGVQVRLGRARRPMPVRRGQKAVTVDQLETTVASTAAGNLLVHVERGPHRAVMGVADLVRRLRLTQREQQRRRLRRAERRVEAGHRQLRAFIGER